jgi:hypothetical protein
LREKYPLAIARYSTLTSFCRGHFTPPGPRLGTGAARLTGLVPLGWPSSLDHWWHVLSTEPQAGTPLRHRRRGLGAGVGAQPTRRAPWASGGARVRPRGRSDDLQEVFWPLRGPVGPAVPRGYRGGDRRAVDPVHARNGCSARPVLQILMGCSRDDDPSRRKTNQLKELSHGLGRKR